MARSVVQRFYSNNLFTNGTNNTVQIPSTGLSGATLTRTVGDITHVYFGDRPTALTAIGRLVISAGATIDASDDNSIESNLDSVLYIATTAAVRPARGPDEWPNSSGGFTSVAAVSAGSSERTVDVRGQRILDGGGIRVHYWSNQGDTVDEGSFFWVGLRFFILEAP